MVDSRASSNVMPLSICKKNNGQLTAFPSNIIQLYWYVFKVIGEMKDVLIILFLDPIVCQFIDIMVVDIPEDYSFILRRYWSTKLNVYFAIDWSHMWLPYQNSQNQIKILREPYIKQNVTQLEGNNEPINFSTSVLGNYFLEIKLGNYQAKEVSQKLDIQSYLLRFSWTDDIDCNVVNLVTNVGDSTNPIDLEDRF